MTILTGTIQLRKGTASEWSDANPVLLAGEEGLETDTNNRKIGDGVTTWNDLAYWKIPTAISADNVGGFTATLLRDRASHTGTQDAATISGTKTSSFISDFTSAVSTVWASLWTTAKGAAQDISGAWTFNNTRFRLKYIATGFYGMFQGFFTGYRTITFKDKDHTIAADDEVVHNTTNETIAGRKTFSSATDHAINNVGNVSGAINLDLSYPVTRIVLTGNVTITPTNAPTGTNFRTGRLLVYQDGTTGNWTLTAASGTARGTIVLNSTASSKTTIGWDYSAIDAKIEYTCNTDTTAN